VNPGEQPQGVERRPGATPTAIREAERSLGVTLPAEYVKFLEDTNGLSGWLNDCPIELWRVEELAENNREYPDYGGVLLIGIDLCGNALALALSATPPPALVFHFIDGSESDPSAVYVGGFDELLGDYGRWFFR
jgi:hypothetical protein